MYIVVLKKSYYKELFDKKNKNIDKQKMDDDLNFYDSLNHYLLIFAAVLTIVGFLIYLGEIKYTYRKQKKFTILEFLHFILGKPPCEYEPEIITPFKALKYAIFEKS